MIPTLFWSQLEKVFGLSLSRTAWPSLTFSVPTIAFILFAKDTEESLTSTIYYSRRRIAKFNVRPRDGTHVDSSSYLTNTKTTVYTVAR